MHMASCLQIHVLFHITAIIILQNLPDFKIKFVNILYE